MKSDWDTVPCEKTKLDTVYLQWRSSWYNRHGWLGVKTPFPSGFLQWRSNDRVPICVYNYRFSLDELHPHPPPTPPPPTHPPHLLQKSKTTTHNWPVRFGQLRQHYDGAIPLFVQTAPRIKKITVLPTETHRASLKVMTSVRTSLLTSLEWWSTKRGGWYGQYHRIR